ncbi:hypothetical protein BGX24_001921 [Mortierella sp. AD032]|nr:hypothetical protein BGX24_001921 [Mortierella sp. AD032]
METQQHGVVVSSKPVAGEPMMSIARPPSTSASTPAEEVASTPTEHEAPTPSDEGVTPTIPSSEQMSVASPPPPSPSMKLAAPTVGPVFRAARLRSAPGSEQGVTVAGHAEATLAMGDLPMSTTAVAASSFTPDYTTEDYTTEEAAIPELPTTVALSQLLLSPEVLSPKPALEPIISKKRNYETAIVLGDTDTDTDTEEDDGDGDGDETDSDDDRSGHDDDEKVSQPTPTDFEFEHDWALSSTQERTLVREFERKPGKWYLSSVQIPPFIPRPKVVHPVVTVIDSDTELEQLDTEVELIDVDNSFGADRSKRSATAEQHPIPAIQSLTLSWMPSKADHEQRQDM